MQENTINAAVKNTESSVLFTHCFLFAEHKNSQMLSEPGDERTQTHTQVNASLSFIDTHTHTHTQHRHKYGLDLLGWRRTQAKQFLGRCKC